MTYWSVGYPVVQVMREGHLQFLSGFDGFSNLYTLPTVFKIFHDPLNQRWMLRMEHLGDKVDNLTMPIGASYNRDHNANWLEKEA